MTEQTHTFEFSPPHPGEYIKEDILPALDLTVGELARHLETGRASLSSLINEKKPVSLEMAVKLGQAFENGARFWLTLQMQYDIWHEERRAKTHVAPIQWIPEESG